MKAIKKFILFLFVLLAIPLDYIGWNLLFSPPYSKVTLKRVMEENFNAWRKAVK